MNTFYRTCVYICLAVLLFSLAITVVSATNAFEGTSSVEGGPQDITQANALDKLTDLDDPTMQAVYSIATAGGVAALVLVWVSHSVTPLGIWLFGTTFWAMWGATQSALNLGSYLGLEFVALINIMIMFCFIAAIIGMLTGSG